MTEAKAKKLGLDEKAVEELIERGQIAQVEARVAETGDAAGDAKAVAAALERAEKAEADVKTLTDTVDKLTKDLAEATKPKPAAA